MNEPPTSASSAVTIETADPGGAEAQGAIAAYFAELQQRFDTGFDPDNSVSATADELVPPRGWLLLARLDGVVAGCGALKMLDSGRGEIKRMWVARSARGRGVAQCLLEALQAQAVEAGLDVLLLDTHRDLVEARRLYERNGFVEIPAYNDNPYADHWFEKRGLQHR